MWSEGLVPAPANVLGRSQYRRVLPGSSPDMIQQVSPHLNFPCGRGFGESHIHTRVHDAFVQRVTSGDDEMLGEHIPRHSMDACRSLSLTDCHLCRNRTWASTRSSQLSTMLWRPQSSTIEMGHFTFLCLLELWRPQLNQEDFISKYLVESWKKTSHHIADTRPEPAKKCDICSSFTNNILPSHKSPRRGCAPLPQL